MWSLNVLVVVSLAALCAADSEENLTASSIELTADNFDKEIDGKNVLVTFYSPSCELSQRFLSKFEKLADALNARDDLKLAHVNCDEDPKFCEAKSAKGLAVYLYRAADDRLQYKGTKTTEGLSKFLIKNLGDAIVPDLLEVPEKLDALNDLDSESFADHVATGNHFVKFYAPWCGHCQHLEPTWDELATSLEYDPSVSISRVDCTQHRPICQEFEVKGYPTLIWIVDGKKVEKYSGSRSLDAFKTFIEDKTATVTEKLEEEQAEEEEAAEEAKVEEVGVLQLTGSSFAHGIEKGVTIVKFFAPWCGHCKRMAPTWDELAVKFIGRSAVKIAKVDCTLGDNKDLCAEQEVDGFPTVYIYRNGEKIEEYNGSRSLDDLFEYVNKHAEGHDEL